MTTTAFGCTISEESVAVWNGKLNIRVKTAGVGKPLLYLHPAGGLYWDQFLAHLTEQFTVYAPEFPGTSPGDPYQIHAIDELSDVVLVYEELTRKLGLTSPAIIGQSFGGMLAAELSAAYPTLPSALVLLDAIGLWNDAYPISNVVAQPPEDLPNLLFRDPRSPAAEAMFSLPDDLGAANDIKAAQVWAMASAAKFTWPIPDRGLRRRLHRIACPTLVVWGRDDTLVPVNYAFEFQSEVHGTEVVVIDECGHIPQVEQEAQTLDAVLTFLNSRRAD